VVWPRKMLRTCVELLETVRAGGGAGETGVEERL
jgi:hypothetical protein